MTSNSMSVSPAVRLEVSKALTQVQFIDRAFSLAVWSGLEDARKWQHDLEWMRQYDDLSAITLELMDENQRVLFAFRIDFNQHLGAPAVDSGAGVELPMLDRRQVRGHRVLVHQKGGMTRYLHRLLMKWNDAPTLQRARGSSYASEHASKITGGRQSGSFFVGSDARRTMVVTQDGHLGYVFAKAIGVPEVSNVFIHRRWAVPGVDLKLGSRLSALLVVTPRGVQARDVRAA